MGRKALEKSSAEDVCAVCDGTGLLLDDPCPLCGEDSADEEPPAPHGAEDAACSNQCAVETVDDLQSGAKDVCLEDEDEEDASNLDLTVDDVSTEEPAADELPQSDGVNEVVDDDVPSWRTPIPRWSCGWRSTSERSTVMDWQYLVIDRSASLNRKRHLRRDFEEKTISIRATVQNTFVHIFQDSPADEGLVRVHSAP